MGRALYEESRAAQDFYGDDEDRARLEKMPMIEREGILAERQTKRERNAERAKFRARQKKESEVRRDPRHGPPPTPCAVERDPPACLRAAAWSPSFCWRPQRSAQARVVRAQRC